MSTEIVPSTNIVPLRAGGRVTAIIPQSVEEVFRLATAISKSGLAPNGMKTAEQITIAIMHGAEIGLPPMQSVQRIAVVNGRPTIWGDAVPALLLSRGFKLDERIEGADDARAAVCIVTRPDGAKIEKRFSIGDARKAGLWGKSGPWSQYPERMLQMRARGFAARDGAADVLAGLYITEEAEDIPTAAPARKSSAEGKRDGSNERFNALRGQIAAATDMATLDRIKTDNAAEIETLPARWAEMIADDLEFKTKDLAAPFDQQAVLRELERKLQSDLPANIEIEYADAIMAMDAAGREQAIEMIQAAKGE